MERMQPYEVYVLTDEQGRITDINSGEFIENITGWLKIDEGTDERHHHAQRNYLPEPLLLDGAYRYKLTGGKVVERSRAEMAADREGEQ